MFTQPINRDGTMKIGNHQKWLFNTEYRDLTSDSWIWILPRMDLGLSEHV
jgi:hypothetical protein